MFDLALAVIASLLIFALVWNSYELGREDAEAELRAEALAWARAKVRDRSWVESWGTQADQYDPPRDMTYTGGDH